MARLQDRYKAADPLYWYTTVPIRWLLALYDQLPMLDARDSLAAYRVAVVAQAPANSEVAQEILAAWQMLARQGQAAAPRTPAPQDIAGVMEQHMRMGIPIVFVDPETGEEESTAG